MLERGFRDVVAGLPQRETRGREAKLHVVRGRADTNFAAKLRAKMRHAARRGHRREIGQRHAAVEILLHERDRALHRIGIGQGGGGVGAFEPTSPGPVCL